MDQADRVRLEETQGSLDINWVTGRIALGGWVKTDEKMRAVAGAGITHIIDVTWECDDTELAEAYGIKALVLAVDDDFQPKAAEVFERGVEFALTALSDPKSKLLIHCVAGRHRGPMMTLAVFCVLGWRMQDAMELITARRPVVDWAPVYVESVTTFLEVRGDPPASGGGEVAGSRRLAGSLNP